jgi:hypothetical protein
MQALMKTAKLTVALPEIKLKKKFAQEVGIISLGTL